MLKSIISIVSVVCALSPAMASLQSVTEAETQFRYSMDFQGGYLQYEESVSIDYSYKVVDYYENPYKVPTFSAGFANSCVVQTGGNAVIYYDRVYDDLVPNYKHTYVFGSFTYGTRTDGVTSMFNSLYTLMGSTSEGTTVNGFKSGMTTYARNNNHTANLTHATGTFYNLNYNYIKNQLMDEKVAVLFLNGFSFVLSKYLKNDQTGQENYQHMVLAGRHAVLAYGYKDIYYYDSNDQLIAYNSYLYVGTSTQSPSQAYLSINVHTCIEDAYVVDIE